MEGKVIAVFEAPKILFMITIRTRDFWTDEPVEAIFEKLRWETHTVKFGPLNAYKNPFQKIRRTWLGEINTKKRTFKLFRVTGESHTSDLSVHGEYITHQSKPLVRVKFKVHFTAFLGLWGLLLCIYAIWYLVNKKGIVISEWLLLPLLLIVGGYYAYTTIRDLEASDRAIESTLYRVYQTEKEAEEMDDEEVDDGAS
jgi:hypothetical protein